MSESLAQKIIDLRDQPEELEQLYRANPPAFREALTQARRIDSTSLILRAWEARLFVKEKPVFEESEGAGETDRSAIWVVIFLCAVSGTIAKLPAFFPEVDEQKFYSRNIAFFFLPALAGYFVAQRGLTWKRLAIITGIFVIAALAINAYPTLYESASKFKVDRSQSTQLAALHLPFFLWSIAGLAFAGECWRAVNTRIAYLRFTGEAIIYFALIMITGGIMTGITVSLFEAIQMKIGKWYFEWIVVYGACAAPIVASHLAFTRTRSTLAPLIARIFSPIALLTLLVYLGAMLVQRRSPYSDREFLMVFNAMLFCVLGVAVFCICERKPSRFFDIVLCALLVVALIIDFIALSAIIYRLAAFGFSPNRIAMLGANILAFINLLGILITFAPAGLRGNEVSAAKNWIARFLPAYTIWTAFVVFVLPIIYRFQ